MILGMHLNIQFTDIEKPDLYSEYQSISNSIMTSYIKE